MISIFKSAKKKQNEKIDFLFIHGFSSQASSHNSLKKWATKKGYKYYALDLPGHGESENKAQLTFDNMIKYVDAYIFRYKLNNIVLAGHSMGGGIASCICAKHKEKVKALILEDPLNYGVFKRSSDDFKSIYERYKVAKETKKRTGIGIFENIYKGKIEYRGLLLNILKPVNLLMIQNAIKQIECPTLLIFGDKDPVIAVKSSVVNFMKNIKNIKVNIIPDSGHSPSKDNPGEYIKAINNFLKDNNLSK